MLQVNDYLTGGRTASEAVRVALASLNGDAGRTLIFAGRDEFVLDEAVLLPSDTTVIIDGCVIRQQDGTFDNVFRGDNMELDLAAPYGYPLAVRPLVNIRIIGRNKAAIIGPEINRRAWHPHFQEEQEMTGDFWGWRTHQINLTQCDGIEISGLAFRRTRGWGLSFDFCSHVVIRDIDFDTRVKNGDGIDFRVGCRHCRVENISGYNSDDTVACTGLNMPVVPPRYLYPSEPSKKFFADDLSRLHISDIVVRNLHVSGRYHAVICLAANGVQVRNISVSDIYDTEDRAFHLVDIYTGYGDGYSQGDIHDIKIDNIVARSSGGEWAAFACRAPVRNVTASRITQLGSGMKVLLPFPEGVQTDEGLNPALDRHVAGIQENITCQ